jgi:MFS transporter, ACS family, hexuronate transporter
MARPGPWTAARFVPYAIDTTGCGDDMSTSMTRYQWLLVALLSANFGVVFFDRNVFSYLTSFIQADLHLSNFQIGNIASAFSFSWAIAGLGMGSLVDRFGRRKLMLVVATVVFSMASVLSGYASGFAWLLGARLLMGIAEGGIMPITQTLIAAEVPHERRGLAQGITQNFGANLLANTLGPVIIVWMAIRFGWRNAFFLAALPGLLMALLIATLVREPAPLAPGSSFGRGGLAAALADRSILLCIAISTLLVAYLMVLFTFTPLYLIQVRGFDQRHMSWIMASYGVASMAVAFLVPGSSDRYGRKPVIVVAALLGLVLPLGLLFISGTQLVPMIACIAVGAALSGAFPLAMATIPSEIMGPARTATALSLTMGVSEILGGVLAPSVAGKVADLTGLGTTLWILVGIIVAIIVLAAMLRETAPAALARKKHVR